MSNFYAYPIIARKRGLCSRLSCICNRNFSISFPEHLLLFGDFGSLLHHRNCRKGKDQPDWKVFKINSQCGHSLLRVLLSLFFVSFSFFFFRFVLSYSVKHSVLGTSLLLLFSHTIINLIPRLREIFLRFGIIYLFIYVFQITTCLILMLPFILSLRPSLQTFVVDDKVGKCGIER